jgi:hypothetical protein
MGERGSISGWNSEGIFFRRRVQIGSGTHPASLPEGKGSLYPRGKAAGE